MATSARPSTDPRSRRCPWHVGGDLLGPARRKRQALNLLGACEPRRPPPATRTSRASRRPTSWSRLRSRPRAGAAERPGVGIRPLSVRAGPARRTPIVCRPRLRSAVARSRRASRTRGPGLLEVVPLTSVPTSLASCACGADLSAARRAYMPRAHAHRTPPSFELSIPILGLLRIQEIALHLGRTSQADVGDPAAPSSLSPASCALLDGLPVLAGRIEPPRFGGNRADGLLSDRAYRHDRTLPRSRDHQRQLYATVPPGSRAHGVPAPTSSAAFCTTSPGFRPLWTIVNIIDDAVETIRHRSATQGHLRPVGWRRLKRSCPSSTARSATSSTCVYVDHG